VVASWTQWRQISFVDNNSVIRPSDAQQVAEISEYMKNNPSLRIGIDGHVNPNNRELSTQRVNIVRDALIRGGVPATQIETGAFGSAANRTDGRVGILIRTGQ
jgi:outer membrane protein OmpA-like peptidoglycan-associated protein